MPSFRIAARILALVGVILATSPTDASNQGIELRLDTILADGGAPIWDAADIWVFRTRGGQRADEVARRHATPAAVMLTPGTYEVAVRYGDATVVAPFEVNGDPDQRLRLNLDAGIVTLGLRNGIDGPAVRGPVDWTVRRYTPGPWSGAVVARAESASPRLVLDAGWYEVTAGRNGETVSHTVEVESGRVLTYDIVAAR